MRHGVGKGIERVVGKSLEILGSVDRYTDS